MKKLFLLLVLVLVGCAALYSRAPSSAPPSALHWGALFSAQHSPEQTRQLNRVLQVAQTSLDVDATPVATLHLEGTLDNDPARKDSEDAIAKLPAVFDIAVCARLAAAPQAASCLAKVKTVLLSWAATYQPTGNPINENSLIPLLQAADLVAPLLADNDRGTIFSWIHRFATEGDAFFARMKPNDTRPYGNWAAWRLDLHALSGTITGDSALQESTRLLVAAFLPKNFSGGGRTYDFQQRDALLYHVYDLEALTGLALFCPEDANPQLLTDISQGLDFIRPFFTGEQTHIEFLHTTVPFDVKRCENGQQDYCHNPWQPKGARKLLRFARALIPEIRGWSQPVVDDQYDPRIKMLAAMLAGDAP